MNLPMNLKELLRGTEPGRIQQVGYMALIPLTSDLVDDDLLSPLERLAVSNSGYGHLHLRSRVDCPVIVPSAVGFLAKGHWAQDHATAKAEVLTPKAPSQDVRDAVCIESSQSGLLKEQQEKEVALLPVSLRNDLARSPSHGGFNRLWSKMAQRSAEAGLSVSRSHYTDFLNHFAKEMDQFVAEFECVPKQIGALIFIDGKLAGVERYPNYKFWREMWSLAIRQGYGGEAIRVANMKKKPALPVTRVELDLQGVETLDQLIVSQDKARQQESEVLRSIWEREVDVLDLGESTQAKDFSGGISLHRVLTDTLSGDIVHKDGTTPYISLITSERYQRQSRWNRASEFKL